MNKKIRVVIFLIGFLICSFPFFSNLAKWQYQKDAIATYQKEVELVEDHVQNYLTMAYEYNEVLYQSYGKYISDWSESILSEESYHDILNITENGVIGSIEIPKINVDLPIYHGTGDDVLSIGIGHLQGTSFPVGGKNTRSVLTGHSGSPISKLFTRLDEMELNDLFFIRILDQILAYKVIEIDVIDPNDVKQLEIIEGKDLLTLLTCTPYGINSHRLIVTGERIEYTKEVYQTIEQERMSLRENIVTWLPFVLLAIGGMTFAIEFIAKKRK